MAYKLNKTDGTLLTELVDGQIDTTSCDLTLIGRNYVGFGEAFNENLIRLLENFAATAAPGTPITGQLWYDKSEGRLKVYDGSGFKSNGPIVSNTQPQMVAGDIWINNADNKLYFYDGSDLVLVGPQYSASQGVSGFQVDTVRARTSVDYTVVKLFVGGALTAIIANAEFTPTVTEQTRLNIIGSIRKGINIVDQDNFRLYGVSDAANSLITDAIDPVTGLRTRKTASQFIPSDENGETIGQLFIRNQSGLTIGSSGETRFFISGDYTNILNTIVNKGIRFRLFNQTDNEYDAITLTANNRRMGVNMPLGTLPRAELDVNGNVIIRGDLTVEGSNTVIETSTLSVDDYTIELGHADTIITLSEALSSVIAGQLTVSDVITQSTSGSTARFKSLSDDRTVLTLEPLNGLFVTGTGLTLTGSVVGTLVSAGGSPLYASSVSQRSNVTSDGGGIIVKGIPSFSNTNDKHLKWTYDSGTPSLSAWEMNDNLNLTSGKVYRIDDTEVMSETAIGVAVETAPGIHDVGVMDRLRIGDFAPNAGTTKMLLDELNLYGQNLPTIQTSSAALRLDSAGTIVVTNSGGDVRITGVAYPSSDPSDATNKEYVDEQIDLEPVTFALDISGMPEVGFATVDAQILDTLEFLYPAAFKEVGAKARIFTSSSVGVVSNIDVASAFDATSITVDFSDIGGTDGGDPGQELIQDIGFTGSATGIVTLSVTRAKRYFRVSNTGGSNFWENDPTP